jgi:ubiquitin C-terminal hydrolase
VQRGRYVGLENQGSTCYMNSLLQQFFMIKEFSSSILKVIKNKLKAILKILLIKFFVFNLIFFYFIKFKCESEDGKESMLHQLKLIFGSLNTSIKPFYSPIGFIKAF